MCDSIAKLTITGYKSIRNLEDFELRPLNVLIGANGCGKSNFIGFFRLLRELIEQRLQIALQTTEGGADDCLFLGRKITPRFSARISFASRAYGFELAPTIDNRFVFAEEYSVVDRPMGSSQARFNQGEQESRLKGMWMFDDVDTPSGLPVGRPNALYKAIASRTVYHFHDTSLNAGVRGRKPLNDDEYLRPDAENLAAFLYRIQHNSPAHYERIRSVVRLAAPFFDDFHLRPVPVQPDLIQLEWRQKDSDYPFRAHQLSDGTLRFICLATALLQPAPPETCLFDEPELGLHPHALTLLGNLFKQATVPQSGRVATQIILATQSAQLLNEFDPEDVIVVERSRGESCFRRLDAADLADWLSDYSLGELWQKNIFGGRPGNEDIPLTASNGALRS